MGDTKPLGIIELLTRVGEDRVQLQCLNDAIRRVNRSKSGICQVIFGTRLLTPEDILRDDQDVFLIVRLPRVDVERAKREHEVA